MKHTLRKLLVLFLAAAMVFSVMAPAMATGTDNSAEAVTAPAAVETTLPDQDWQMNRDFWVFDSSLARPAAASDWQATFLDVISNNLIY